MDPGRIAIERKGTIRNWGAFEESRSWMRGLRAATIWSWVRTGVERAKYDTSRSVEWLISSGGFRWERPTDNKEQVVRILHVTAADGIRVITNWRAGLKHHNQMRPGL